MLVVAQPLPTRIKPHTVENSSVATPATYPWWSGATTVSQQWGCTTSTLEGTYIPSGYSCPAGVTHWHHGIDFADVSGQSAVNCQPPTSGLTPGPGYTLLANRAGTISKIDVPVPQQYDHTSMLQILIADGHYVNLFHVQSVLSGLALGSTVFVGEPIATVGDAGWPDYATACHLHFEVDQTNVIGDNGGYDVDPTPYLPALVVVSSRASGNFLGTGYDASAALYDFTTYAKVLVWPNTSGSQFGAWSAWWDSRTAAPDAVWPNFDAKKAKIVAGYFTNSQYADIAILYDASDASCANHAIWYLLKSTGSSFQTFKWWDSQTALIASLGCQFSVSRSKPVAADFDADGRTDVAVLYDESTGGCSASVVWWVFLSTPTGFLIDTSRGDPYLAYSWYASGCNAFDWSKSKPMAGYFGSSLAEVAVFYDYSITCAAGQPRSRVYTFSTTGTWFPDYSFKWDSGANCNRYPWNQSLPVAGNFTGHSDGKSDVAVLFDSSSACTNQPRTQLYLLIWNSTTNVLEDSTQSPWDSGCNQFAWNWSKVEAGKFTANNVADLAVLYYYTWHCPVGQVDAGWLVFVPSGSGFTSYSRWDPYPPCNGVDWNMSAPT